MDLKVIVIDENGDDRYVRTLYRDGSDSEAADKIAELIEGEFGTPTGDEL